MSIIIAVFTSGKVITAHLGDCRLGKISGNGMALGYIGGILSLFIMLFFFFDDGGKDNYNFIPDYIHEWIKDRIHQYLNFVIHVKSLL